MTIEQLQALMIFHLNSFNDEGIEINNNTIHNLVLSDSDGYGNATSKKIYKLVIRRGLVSQNHDDKPWPVNWMDLSVNELASRLLQTP